jgi:glycine/D-amino acid oxidase-like deaminating enzyme
MDLRSHSPYWLLKNGLVRNYPSLQKDHRTDIAIMGAGITGALIAWHLCQAGFEVTIVDKRHAGMGSTAASTALLQYEIDTPLHALVTTIGLKNALRSYELCASSILSLKKICHRYSNEAGFRKRPSLQFASSKKDVSGLKKEYELRRENGFSIQWWEAEEVQAKMGFDAPAAVLSGLGAEMDAYRLTHQLLAACIRKGAKVFDNTAVTAINHYKNKVSLQVENKSVLNCRHLVIACGYESQQYIPKKIEKLEATYAMVSEPFEQAEFWYRNCLIWETAVPYLYMRTTSDKRILVGGMDDDFYNPDKRDARIAYKSKQLLKAFSRKFPGIPFLPDFKWAGTFASTKDGLPYIGSIRQRPNTSFALGFGGNGITFSLVAAELLRNQLKGKPDKELNIFSFNR